METMTLEYVYELLASYGNTYMDAVHVIDAAIRERDELLAIKGDALTAIQEEHEWLQEHARADKAEAELTRRRDVFLQVLVSLVAAVDLLRRGGKKAAPSDKMFAAMLADYEKAIEAGRAVLATKQEHPNG